MCETNYAPNPERVASRPHLVHSRCHAAIIGQDSRAYRLLHQRPPSLAARHRATERIAPLSGNLGGILKCGIDCREGGLILCYNSVKLRSPAINKRQRSPFAYDYQLSGANAVIQIALLFTPFSGLPGWRIRGSKAGGTVLEASAGLMLQRLPSGRSDRERQLERQRIGGESFGHSRIGAQRLATHAIAVESDRDVFIATDTTLDRLGVLFAVKERLPGVNVLGLVEIAIREER